MGLLLTAVFILGGVIGGLAGVAASHEGREFRDFHGRGNLTMMGGGRFGNDFGSEGGVEMGRNFIRTDSQQGIRRMDARTPVAPQQSVPATTTAL